MFLIARHVAGKGGFGVNRLTSEVIDEWYNKLLDLLDEPVLLGGGGGYSKYFAKLRGVTVNPRVRRDLSLRVFLTDVIPQLGYDDYFTPVVNSWMIYELETSNEKPADFDYAWRLNTLEEFNNVILEHLKQNEELILKLQHYNGENASFTIIAVYTSWRKVALKSPLDYIPVDFTMLDGELTNVEIEYHPLGFVVVKKKR